MADNFTIRDEWSARNHGSGVHKEFLEPFKTYTSILSLLADKAVTVVSKPYLWSGIPALSLRRENVLH